MLGESDPALSIPAYIRSVFAKAFALTFEFFRTTKMFLKVTTPSDETATAVVETAIKCGSEPTDIKKHRLAGSDELVYSVYLQGSQQKLDECRRAIVKEPYYRSDSFYFRTALTTATLATEAEE